MSLFRPTLRLRMALLYGALVVLVGVSVLFTAILLIKPGDHGRQHVRSSRTGAKVSTVTVRHGSVHRPTIWPATIAATRAAQRSAKLLHDRPDLLRASWSWSATTGGYLLAKQALRPIARLTKTAKQMSTETLDQRINLGGPDDELRELADTFDDMLGRLDAAFESQRLFVANASHELRTPADGDQDRARGHHGRPGRGRRRNCAGWATRSRSRPSARSGWCPRC